MAKKKQFNYTFKQVKQLTEHYYGTLNNSYKEEWYSTHLSVYAEGIDLFIEWLEEEDRRPLLLPA